MIRLADVRELDLDEQAVSLLGSGLILDMDNTKKENED